MDINKKSIEIKERYKNSKKIQDLETREVFDIESNAIEGMLIEQNSLTKEYRVKLILKGISDEVLVYHSSKGYAKSEEKTESTDSKNIDFVSKDISSFISKLKEMSEKSMIKENEEDEEEEETKYYITESELKKLFTGELSIKDLFSEEEYDQEKKPSITKEEAEILLGKKIV